MRKPIPRPNLYASTGLASLLQNSGLTQHTVTLEEFERTLAGKHIALYGNYTDDNPAEGVMPASITFVIEEG